MLYEPPKTKKYILIGAAAIVLVVLAVFIFQKTRQKIAKPLPVDIQKANEEKQKEIMGAINKANESVGQNQLPQEEENKKKQEMTDVINKANTEAPNKSEEEARKRQQDMLNAINEVNKK
jgi:hypothetical protein